MLPARLGDIGVRGLRKVGREHELRREEDERPLGLAQHLAAVLPHPKTRA